MYTSDNMVSRRTEIDLLRTLAIMLMIVYHAAYDLSIFYGWDIPVQEGAWKILARIAASLFLLLVGISFTLSYRRRFPGRVSPLSAPVLYTYGLRGLRILLLGMILTVGSYLFDPATFIRFGILHCIGITTLLLPFAMPLEERAALLGIGVILLGRMFAGMHAESEVFVALNILPAGFSSIDFYPLVPWSGVVLIGMSIGHVLYRDPASQRRLASLDRSKLARVLAWPGRNALLLYFLHQPVIMAVFIAWLGRP